MIRSRLFRIVCLLMVGVVAIGFQSEVWTGTSRTTNVLMYMFRDGQANRSILPSFVRDIIASVPQVINVRGAGAQGDYVTDDTAVIQTCINNAQTAGGGEVVFPPGNYLVDTLTITRSNLTRRGAGHEGTKFIAKSSNMPIFDVSINVGYSNLIIRDLMFYGGGSTNLNYAIRMAPQVSGVRVENVVVENYKGLVYADRIAKSEFRGITTAGTATGFGYIGSTIDGASGYSRGIYIDGVQQRLNTSFTTESYPFMHLDRVVDSTVENVNTFSPIGSGTEEIIRISNGSEGIRIRDLLILGAGYGIHFARTTVGSTTIAPRWMNVSQAQIDSYDFEGIRVDGGRWIEIHDSLISTADSSSLGCRGIYVIPSAQVDDTISIHDNTFQNFFNPGAGCAPVYISAGTQYVQVRGNRFTGTNGYMVVFQPGPTNHYALVDNMFAMTAPAQALVNSATGTDYTISGNLPAISNVHSASVETSAPFMRIGQSATPASGSAECGQGSFVWDSNYLYWCVGTNHWKRAPFSDF